MSTSLRPSRSDSFQRGGRTFSEQAAVPGGGRRSDLDVQQQHRQEQQPTRHQQPPGLEAGSSSLSFIALRAAESAPAYILREIRPQVGNETWTDVVRREFSSLRSVFLCEKEEAGSWLGGHREAIRSRDSQAVSAGHVVAAPLAPPVGALLLLLAPRRQPSAPTFSHAPLALPPSPYRHQQPAEDPDLQRLQQLQQDSRPCFPGQNSPFSVETGTNEEETAEADLPSTSRQHDGGLLLQVQKGDKVDDPVCTLTISCIENTEEDLPRNANGSDGFDQDGAASSPRRDVNQSSDNTDIAQQAARPLDGEACLSAAVWDAAAGDAAAAGEQGQAKAAAAEKKRQAKTAAAEKKRQAKAAAAEKKRQAKTTAAEKKRQAKTTAAEKKRQAKTTAAEKKRQAKTVAAEKKPPEKGGQIRISPGLLGLLQFPWRWQTS